MKASEINKFLQDNIEKSDVLRIVFKDNNFKIGALLHANTNKNQWNFIRDVDLEDFCETQDEKLTNVINGEDIVLLLLEPLELRQKSESYNVIKYLKQKQKEAMEKFNN
ncbi:hypothetical protein [uncultured Flavobacterium sp.]|jgi:hypothetical protein|uniref:hypothetical protein n=1 Tax=uncultured Flavobacterium sp. TaxID=165435 RepID=UPI002597853C|nr:hypothetical protein [uncultured Flavobacterium sp.]